MLCRVLSADLSASGDSQRIRSLRRSRVAGVRGVRVGGAVFVLEAREKYVHQGWAVPSPIGSLKGRRIEKLVLKISLYGTKELHFFWFT